MRYLPFGGYQIGEDGKIRPVDRAQTLSEAQARASRLRVQLLQRRVHPDVMRFCRLSYCSKTISMQCSKRQRAWHRKLET